MAISQQESAQINNGASTEGTFMEFAPSPAVTLSEKDNAILEFFRPIWESRIVPFTGWNRDFDEFKREHPEIAKNIATQSYGIEPAYMTLRIGAYQERPGYSDYRITHNVRLDKHGKAYAKGGHLTPNICRLRVPGAHFDIDPVSGEPVLKGITVTPLTEKSSLLLGSHILEGEVKRQLVEIGRYCGPVEFRDKVGKDGQMMKDKDGRSLKEYGAVSEDDLRDMMVASVGKDGEKARAAKDRMNDCLVLTCSRNNPSNILALKVGVRKYCLEQMMEGMDEDQMLEAALGYDVSVGGKVCHYDNQMGQLVEGPTLEQVRAERHGKAEGRSETVRQSLSETETVSVGKSPSH